MFQKLDAYKDILYAIEDVFLCCHPLLTFPFGSVCLAKRLSTDVLHTCLTFSGSFCTLRLGVLLHLPQFPVVNFIFTL